MEEHKKKRILYLIYSSDVKSGGGHFYTLLTLVEKMSKFIDFKILNVGLIYPLVLKNNSLPSDFIPISKGTYYNDLSKLRLSIKEFDPNVIHAFDLNSLRAARSINYKKVPIVFNKCGGVNGPKVVADAAAYICFSEENLIHIKKYKSNNSPLYLIPNRATKIISDNDRINQLKSDYSLDSKKVLLRISRFSEMHELSILQAVNLFKLIHEGDKDSCLFLIGIVQSEDVLARITAAADGFPVHIITDEYFCKDASGLIDVADIVIATGRGVMEAASLGKIIFCPVEGESLPAPLNAENFQIMSKFNFSGRTRGITVEIADIVRQIHNESDELSAFSTKMFTEQFDIEAVIPKYLDIYETAKYDRPTMRSFINYCYDMLYFFKPNINLKKA